MERNTGILPAPVGRLDPRQRQPGRITTWDGFGSNISLVATAAPQAGFFNAIADSDGVVRSTLLLTEYTGHFFKSLALAMFRRLIGYPVYVSSGKQARPVRPTHSQAPQPSP